jgi:hypothetical protein
VGLWRRIVGHDGQSKYRNITKVPNILELLLVLHKYETNEILYHDLNVSQVRDEIKKLNQKYVNRIEEHHNIFTTNFMRNATQIKIKIFVSDRIVIL